MAKNVKVIVLRTAGTNCNAETAFAFRSFGAQVDQVHIKKLIDQEVYIRDYHILAIPGGFTYGDDIESGRILANELSRKLGPDICQFIGDQKLIIGICNGFQVLVKSGILPGPLDDNEAKAHDSSQKATLFNNNSGKFEARWTHLKVEGKSPWLANIKEISLPIAHGEGHYVISQKEYKKMRENKEIAFVYQKGEICKFQNLEKNPNGSDYDIAGVLAYNGRVLGLMPHPERAMFTHQSPMWQMNKSKNKVGSGLQIFKNAINYFK